MWPNPCSVTFFFFKSQRTSREHLCPNVALQTTLHRTDHSSKRPKRALNFPKMVMCRYYGHPDVDLVLAISEDDAAAFRTLRRPRDLAARTTMRALAASRQNAIIGLGL